MSARLYPALQTALGSLVDKIAAERSTQFTPGSSEALPPLSPVDLTTDVQQLWTSIDSEDGASGSNRGDIIRSVLDLVGREVVIGPIVTGELPVPADDSTDLEKCQFQTMISDRLDIVLTLYEVVYPSHQDSPSLEPGAIFIPLLEELVELISVDSWRELWTYVETRSKRFTKDMPASKGKALPLLRTINAFLRFLPRTPQDLVFRGRVHQFASSVISIADKSAINMRGDYGELKTTWDPPGPQAEPHEGEEQAAASKEEVDGDVKMDAEEKKEQIEEKEATPDFYSTLWSLQHYFSSPPALAGPPTPAPDGKPIAPFDDFRSKSDFVLPKLFEQTQKEREMMGKEVDGSTGTGKKRKRDDEDGGFFHPRYLTGKRLLEHELADPSFRRQILVQYFILFQFLLNLTPSSASKQAFTGGMPKDFVLDNEKESWVKIKIVSIRDEMKKMPKDGARFEEIVLAIITRERHYAQWKNDACPEGIFELPPLDARTAVQSAQNWKKRVGPPPRWPFPVGSRSLSRLWNKGFTSLDQLKGWKRSTTVESLASEIGRIEAEEEDDKAMGIEVDAEKAAENKAQKTKLNWQAMRLASKSDLRHFGAFASGRNIKRLDEVKEEEEKKRIALIAKVKASRESKSGAPKSEAPEVDSGAEKSEEPEAQEQHEAGADEVAVDVEDDPAGQTQGEVQEGAVDEPAAAGDVSMEGKETEVGAAADDEAAEQADTDVKVEQVGSEELKAEELPSTAATGEGGEAVSEDVQMA